MYLKQMVGSIDLHESTLYLLLHFSLSVKAVTLIFISGRDLAISSTHEGKTGDINGKTENFNCLLRVNGPIA